MTNNAPQFSPAKGVGTKYKDGSGLDWVYTNTGWVEAGKENIVDNTKKDSFNVKPDEDPLFTTLKTNGAKDADIQAALDQRKTILATKTEETPPASSDLDIEPIKTKTVDPFKGKTRTQVMKEAFLGGVTDSTELKKIGDTYDLLATPEEEINANIDKLSPVEQEIAKKSIEKQAVLKMQSLPDATARDSALAALSTFRSGKDIINTLDSGTVETGLVKGKTREGVFGIGARSLGKTTKEEDAFAAQTEVFAANFRKALSGTQASDVELARLDKFLPSEKKTKQANIQGIIEISNYLSDKTSLQLNYDISPLVPTEISTDPLNITGSGASKNNPLGI